jgi:predicted metal-dependent hydrolase
MQKPASKENGGNGCCSSNSVNLQGRTVHYTVRRSRRAKHLCLKVHCDSAELEVVVPGSYDLGLLEVVLQRKQDWVLDQLNRYQQLKKLALPGQDGGKRVYYRGCACEVVMKVEQGNNRSVFLSGGKLVVTVPAGSENEAGAVLEQWLRSAARQIITQRVEIISKALKLSYNRIFIRNQKTRWGSCSQKRNLNFNWRLVMAPPDVLDYIIIHELMHLIELNHSKKFWRLVADVCPDYQIQRAWLRKNGSRLTLTL